MKNKTFWVPRGYYSETKIKEDDVQMVPVEEVEELISKHGIHIESGRCFGIKYHEAKGDLHKFVYDLLRVVTKPRGEE